jgi:hypothetical protein
MNKFLASFAILGVVTAIGICSPQSARAEDINDGYIGPAVTFGDGKTTLGVSAKMRLGGNIALRPYLDFIGGRTPYGASLTYDLVSRQAAPSVIPYVGYGVAVDNDRSPNVSGFFNLGVDANLSEKFTLFTSATLPTSKEFNSRFVVGASLRF